VDPERYPNGRFANADRLDRGRRSPQSKTIAPSHARINAQIIDVAARECAQDPPMSAAGQMKNLGQANGDYT